MQTNKRIKDWMEQLDAIIEEAEGIDEVADYGQNELVNNIIDIANNAKKEMQECIDKDLIIGTSIAFGNEDNTL